MSEAPAEQRTIAEGALLLAVGQALSLNLSPEESMRRVAREVARAFGVDMVGFYLLGKPPDGLLPAAGYHVPAPLAEWFRTTALHIGTSESLREAWATRRPAWTTDASLDGRWVPAVRDHLPPHSAVFGPMVVRDEPIGGLFLVWWKTGRAFTEADVQLLQGVTSQVGLVLSNIELAREAQGKLRETEILTGVATTITAALDLDTVLQRIVEGARELCGSDIARVALREPDGALVFRQGSGGRWPFDREVRVLPGQGIGGWVIAHAQPFRTDDYPTDPRITQEHVGFVLSDGVAAVLGVPIRIGAGVEGVLYVANPPGRPLGDHDEAVLARLADHAAIAIQNARLYRDAAERAQKLKALSTLTRLITESPSSPSVFHAIAMAAVTLLGARVAEVWIEAPGRRTLRLAGWFSAHPNAEQLLPEISSIPAGRGVTGRVFETAEPLYLEDIQGHPRFLHQGVVTALDLHAYAGAPLVVGDHAMGVLAAFFGERRGFGPDDKELMSLLAGHAGIAIRNTQFLEREQASRAAIEASEERYRLLFARNLAGIFRATADGQMLECNEAFARLLGYASREEVLGHPASAFYADPEQHAQLAGRLTAGQCYAGLELSFRRKDGAEIWVLMNLLAARDGEVDSLEGTIIDVTDHRRAETAERHAEALRSVASLAIAAAHEINNPLAALLASAELIGRKIDRDSPLRPYTERLVTNIARIKDIVERMGHITRLELTKEWGQHLPAMLDLRRSSLPPRPAPHEGGGDQV